MECRAVQWGKDGGGDVVWPVLERLGAAFSLAAQHVMSTVPRMAAQ